MIIYSCTNVHNETGDIFYHYWIQKHDYSSTEKRNISVNDAISAFLNYNWERELSLKDDSVESKNCPAGIGIHNGYGEGKGKKSLLHICPINSSSIFFNLHFPIEKKLFGIFPYTNEDIYYAENVPYKIVPELITHFFQNDYQRIKEMTKQYAPPNNGLNTDASVQGMNW